jgi:hypothetical protein
MKADGENAGIGVLSNLDARWNELSASLPSHFPPGDRFPAPSGQVTEWGPQSVSLQITSCRTRGSLSGGSEGSPLAIYFQAGILLRLFNPEDGGNMFL